MVRDARRFAVRRTPPERRRAHSPVFTRPASRLTPGRRRCVLRCRGPKIVINDIYRTPVRLEDEGLTILLIEQAATTAIAFADRTAMLVGGRIVLEGDRAELSASDDVVRHYLGVPEG